MNGIRIGRIFGIEIAIHPTWFIVLALFAFSLATGLFPRSYPAWSAATNWTVAVVATLLLFASVLAHELGHSLVAKSQGIPVKNITLFLLGGVSSLEKEASSPGREALMAGVGPLVSLVLGAGAWIAAWLLPGPEVVRAALLYLGIANVSLAAFNLLPGFPLDGGRVLRALLWWRSHDFTRATRKAATVGQGFGYAFLAFAAIQVLWGAVLSGVWIGFIGWILIQASRASAAQAELDHELEGVSALRLMTQPSTWLKPFVTLDWAAQRGFTDYDSRCLPVESETEDAPYGGLVCLNDFNAAERERWGIDRVRDVMQKADGVPAVSPETPAVDVVRIMRLRRKDRVAVVREGTLLGFIDPAAIERFVRGHHEAHDRAAHPTAA